VRRYCFCIAISSDSCASPRPQRTILIFLVCLGGGCICLSIPFILQAGIAKVTGIRRVPQWRLASPALHTFWFVTEWHQTQALPIQSRFISRFLLPSPCLTQKYYSTLSDVRTPLSVFEICTFLY